MEAAQIAENVNVLLGDVIRKKPADAKGDFIKSVYIASTMGPGVKVLLKEGE